MKQAKFLEWVIVIALLIKTGIVNAQEHKNLDKQQQSIVAISALTAVGNLDNLKIQLNAGLENGLTVNQVKEVLVQLYAYCGFPRSLNAVNTFSAVMAERQKKGISDQVGKEPVITDNSNDKYERGRKVLEELTKTPQSRPAPGFGEFAPRIDAFLKEHLFADIFESDVLSHQQRELVTISALAAMTGVQSQLNSHIKIGINTGLTERQLLDIASIISAQINPKQGEIMLGLLNKKPGEISPQKNKMMVRIAEIEIAPNDIAQYIAILKEEAEASVRLEAGVLAIFPMTEKEDAGKVRILEIYQNEEAYQQHLKSSHFIKYKTSTQKMVKSLKLVDMNEIDTQTMSDIFIKLQTK